MWERGREQERVCLCAPVTEPGSLHIYANTHALARAQTRIYTHVHVCRTAKSTRGRARARDCLCYLFYRRYVLVFCTCARTHARTHAHTHTPRGAHTWHTLPHTLAHVHRVYGHIQLPSMEHRKCGRGEDHSLSVFPRTSWARPYTRQS